MKLPIGERATIDPLKITDYALSFAHPQRTTHVDLFERLLGIRAAQSELLLRSNFSAIAS